MYPPIEADQANLSSAAKLPDSAMGRVQLRFYTREDQKCHIAYVHEWLLLLARRLDISTATATRTLAGFDRNSGAATRHVEDMAAGRTVIVEMLASEEQAQRVLDLLAAENLGLPYTRHTVTYAESPRA